MTTVQALTIAALVLDFEAEKARAIRWAREAAMRQLRENAETQQPTKNPTNKRAFGVSHFNN